MSKAACKKFTYFAPTILHACFHSGTG